MQQLEESLKSQLIDIVHECQTRLLAMYQQVRETSSSLPTDDANAVSPQQSRSRQAERPRARAELADLYGPPPPVQGYSNGPDLDEIQIARQHIQHEPSDSGYGSANITFQNPEPLNQLHSQTHRRDEEPSNKVDVVENFDSQTATSQYPSFDNLQTNQPFESPPPSYIPDPQSYPQTDSIFPRSFDDETFQVPYFGFTRSLDGPESFTSTWPFDFDFDEPSSLFPSIENPP
jgi:hypothetical protein